jgi:hypothetical protein
MSPPLPSLLPSVRCGPPTLGVLLLSVLKHALVERGRNKVVVFAFVVCTRGTRFLHVGCVINTFRATIAFFALCAYKKRNKRAYHVRNAINAFATHTARKECVGIASNAFVAKLAFVAYPTHPHRTYGECISCFYCVKRVGVASNAL